MPTPIGKERKAELEKKKCKEKLSPLPTMKLEPTITESKPIRQRGKGNRSDDFEL